MGREALPGRPQGQQAVQRSRCSRRRSLPTAPQNTPTHVHPTQLLARRRVLHFGHEFDYATRGVGEPQPAAPLPPAARAAAARLEALPGGVRIDQLTVNEYAPGVGIAPHVGE